MIGIQSGKGYNETHFIYEQYIYNKSLVRTLSDIIVWLYVVGSAWLVFRPRWL